MIEAVYTLDAALNDFAGLYLLEASERERWRPIDGQPKAASWEPPAVSWEVERSEPTGDFAGVDLFRAFTTDAYRQLAPVLEGRGEALALDVKAGPPAVAFNVTRLIDALDEERSVIKRFDDGRVMRIKEARFRPERLEGETIFKLAIWPRGDVYVTDAFVAAAEREGITGMRLNPVWTAGGAGEGPEGPEVAGEERVFAHLVPGPEDLGPPDEPVAHHIIPPLAVDSAELERAQAHAQALGIDPDEAANGVLLPRAQHLSAYTDGYFTQLWERFGEAGDREEGVAVLAGIAEELRAGRFPRR